MSLLLCAYPPPSTKVARGGIILCAIVFSSSLWVGGVRMLQQIEPFSNAFLLAMGEMQKAFLPWSFFVLRSVFIPYFSPNEYNYFSFFVSALWWRKNSKFGRWMPPSHFNNCDFQFETHTSLSQQGVSVVPGSAQIVHFCSSFLASARAGFFPFRGKLGAGWENTPLACSPRKECSFALFGPQIKELGQKGVKATLVLLGLSLKMVERRGGWRSGGIIG